MAGSEPPVNSWSGCSRHCRTRRRRVVAGKANEPCIAIGLRRAGLAAARDHRQGRPRAPCRYPGTASASSSCWHRPVRESTRLAGIVAVEIVEDVAVIVEDLRDAVAVPTMPPVGRRRKPSPDRGPSRPRCRAAWSCRRGSAISTPIALAMATIGDAEFILGEPHGHGVDRFGDRGGQRRSLPA